jgi:hypothetical protein
MQTNLEPFDQGGVLLLTSTIVLGFTLHSLNTFIYKILEGYHFLARFPWLRRRQRRKYEKLESQLTEVEKDIAKLRRKIDYNQLQIDRLKEIKVGIEKKLNSLFLFMYTQKGERFKSQVECVCDQIEQLYSRIEEDEAFLQKLEDKRYYIVSEMHLSFPLRKEAILPTGFGNILRAAEAYPVDRYGIDAVRLWPRLVHVIPESYYEKVEQSNNGLAFLVNCSVLSLLMSLLSIIAVAYQYYLRLVKLDKAGLLYFIVNEDIKYNPDVYLQRICLYVVVFALALLMFCLFYRGSLPVVKQYGNMIRSSYDLFRMQLLKALNQKIPDNSIEEYNTWSKVSEFVAIGDHRGPLSFKYQVSTEGSNKP